MGEFGEIPGLYQKLRLLISLGFYKNWESLADAFGVRPGTVKSWANGSDKQRPDWVPAKHQPTLIAIFGQALAGKNYSRANVKSLILASPRDLEAELRAAQSYALAELIEREGRNDSCALFTRSSRLDLVSRSRARKRVSQFRLALGKDFRLEFHTDINATHTFALQHINRLWGALDSSFDLAQRVIHVIGFDERGEPDFMCERDHDGDHRFIVLQTKGALPASVQNALRQHSVLDNRTLNELSDFYADQKMTERRIFYVDIEIDKPDIPSETNQT